MTLRLEGLEVDCVIGERPDERDRVQRLRVDAELEVDGRLKGRRTFKGSDPSV